MVEKLNHFLADLVVEYHKLQNFHWYVKGLDFFTVHAKLEEYYDYISDAVDEVAEKILMIQGKPLASLQEFCAHASIQEAASDYVTSSVIWEAVLHDFSALLDEALDIKKAADAAGNSLISGAMDSYIENFSKSIWMLGQRAQ